MRTQYTTTVVEGYLWWQIIAILGVFFVGMFWWDAARSEYEEWILRRREHREEKQKSLLLESTIRGMIDKAVEPPRPPLWKRMWSRMWDWTHGVPGPVEEAADDSIEVWDTTVETGEQFVERTKPPESDYGDVTRYWAMGDEEDRDQEYEPPADEYEAPWWEEPAGWTPPPPSADDEPLVTGHWWVRGTTLHTSECSIVRNNVTAIVVPPATETVVRAWAKRQDLHLCLRCDPLPEKVQA